MFGVPTEDRVPARGRSMSRPSGPGRLPGPLHRSNSASGRHPAIGRARFTPSPWKSPPKLTRLSRRVWSRFVVPLDTDSPMDRRALGPHSRPRGKCGRVRLLRLHGDPAARDGVEQVPGSSALDRSLMAVRPMIRASEAAIGSASSDVVRRVPGADATIFGLAAGPSPIARSGAALAPEPGRPRRRAEGPGGSLDNRRGKSFAQIRAS